MAHHSQMVAYIALLHDHLWPLQLNGIVYYNITVCTHVGMNLQEHLQPSEIFTVKNDDEICGTRPGDSCPPWRPRQQSKPFAPQGATWEASTRAHRRQRFKLGASLQVRTRAPVRILVPTEPIYCVQPH